MEENQPESGAEVKNEQPAAQPQQPAAPQYAPQQPYQSNGPQYGAPYQSAPNYGAPQQPYHNAPYGAPQYTPQQPYQSAPPAAPSQVRAPIKGKPFAIVAFVFGIIAFIFFMSAVSTDVELELAQELADRMTEASTDYYYYVENVDVLKMTIIVCCVFSIIAALVSDILVIFAYLGHAKNVKNGNPAKFVLVFAIIATVLANIALISSISYM